MSKKKKSNGSLKSLINAFAKKKGKRRKGYGLGAAAGLGTKKKGERRGGGIAAAAGLKGRPRKRSVMSLISRAWDKGDPREARKRQKGILGMARTANNAWRMITRDTDARRPTPGEAKQAIADAELTLNRVGRELGASDRSALRDVIDRLTRWLGGNRE